MLYSETTIILNQMTWAVIMCKVAIPFPSARAHSNRHVLHTAQSVKRSEVFILK